MLRWLRDNSFILTLLTLTFLCVVLAQAAHADVKGIPFNERFQTASYPYARQIDGCTAWRRPDRLGDAWSVVSFSGACQQHDRCYHTAGSTWAECNDRFLKDMRAACDRDLEKARLEAGRRGKPDAQALQLCYAIADLYAARVQTADAARRYDFDQKQEAAYLAWVAGVVNEVYRGALRRDATEKEKTRALVTLEHDYSLDDLKTALMGHKLDLQVEEAPMPAIDDASDIKNAIDTGI